MAYIWLMVDGLILYATEIKHHKYQESGAAHPKLCAIGSGCPCQVEYSGAGQQLPEYPESVLNR